MIKISDSYNLNGSPQKNNRQKQTLWTYVSLLGVFLSVKQIFVISNIFKVAAEQTQKSQNDYKRDYQTIAKAFNQLGKVGSLLGI